MTMLLMVMTTCIHFACIPQSDSVTLDSVDTALVEEHDSAGTSFFDAFRLGSSQADSADPAKTFQIARTVAVCLEDSLQCNGSDVD